MGIGISNLTGGNGGINPNLSSSSGPAMNYGAPVTVGGFNVPSFPFGSGARIGLMPMMAMIAVGGFLLWALVKRQG